MPLPATPKLLDGWWALCARRSFLTRVNAKRGLLPLVERFPDADPDYAIDGWAAGNELIFADGEQGLGRMDDATWQRTIEYHSQVFGTPKLSSGSVFDSSFLP